MAKFRASDLIKTVSIALVVVVGCIASGMAGCPAYNVYSAKMKGEAELAQAEQNRQINVSQSKAKADAAQFEAAAEVTRAGGLAASIKITGDALQKNPEYLRYLYVNNLAESKDQIIYVPTEAGLPILEAGRRPADAPAAH